MEGDPAAAAATVSSSSGSGSEPSVAPSTTTLPSLDAPKPKQRRVTQACDYCHQRSIRCRPCGDGLSCANCKDFDQPCTYHRKPRRRGVQPRGPTGRRPPESATHAERTPPDASKTPSSPLECSRSAPAPPHSLPFRRPDAGRVRDGDHVWAASSIASQATIVDLVDLYFEIVYPIFPFFHQPSFTRRISRADHLDSRPLFATTMAVCALVSSRIRDGSVSNPRWNLACLCDPSPDVFYAEAERQLVDITEDACLDVLRAHAVLAIAAIQNCRIRDMNRHLGTYHTLVAMDALHDESNWPAGIGVVEKEERRRLFWSIYTLDIYASVVWGGIIRSREQQSNVAYPIEVDDEFIDDAVAVDDDHSPHSASSTLNRGARTVRSDCWLSGWNFITDLYRVLEHALTRFRYNSNRSRRQSFLHEIFDDKFTSVTEASVRDSVLRMYIDLPARFKETPKLTYNVKQDRFGFQAANITGSLQLVRMVLFAAGGASIDERCQIVREVVDAFVSVPVSYLLAISTPLLYHLGGIGAFLGSVFEEPLSECDYGQVRSIMLSLAQLLEHLEAMHHSASASEKLRSQVKRIDDYMRTQRHAVPVRPPPSAPPEGRLPVLATQTTPPEAGNMPAASYQPLGLPMTDSWSFQVPAEMLDELNWNFDFGSLWNG
ncbi:hypothetical protein DCS_06049 [Drechmeria coniospora]|uniref:Zn(2)-C6 fungal-type domain-containing protein n=1 Tax=Drechmeria coniospora TaxID=98403 RepID=A0A151GAG7_DRECN|nr:hypothetical protein DCS_06049 [Drechmeria coniospora]KYK54093.1 hypothetical protein DCS_06049 [Drechmeria coniospora]ODA77597.1 hypothetical protein RJ55_07226 [Drechmeria coniospora]